MTRPYLLHFTSLVILFILLFPGTVLQGAGPDSIQARLMAEVFYSARLADDANSSAFKSSVESDLVLRYISPDSAYSRVYLYENMSGGYVMVLKTGEEMLVCAYSTKHSPQLENENSTIPVFLEMYEHVESIEEPSALKSAQAVSPLLDIEQIKWDQALVYNEACPFDTEANTYAYAGCVAVAMGQVMRYHKFPDTGTGAHSYIHPKYGELSADFENTTYNWSNMPGSISTSNSDIANFLFQCGVAVDMNYAATVPGSGAFLSLVTPAMNQYFSYPSATFVNQDNFYYVSDEYQLALQNELNKNRPFLFGLNGDSHMVVCDGYDGDYFHMNFGWGGGENGYFLLTDIEFIGPYQFGFMGDAIIGITPDPIRCNEQDSLALVALYNTTAGNNWTHKDNWLSANVSTWYGVVVIDGRVVHLDLYNNQLIGPLPADLGNLDALTILNLASNQLTGEIAFLGNMSHLLHMNLGSNQLSGTIPAGIGSNTELLNLNLGYNNLTGEIPGDIGNLTQLKYLTLGDNTLTGSIPEEICNLTALSYLYLSNNQLSGDFPENIGNLIHLKDFQISNNQFEGNLPKSIASLSGLISFEIGNNQFSGALPPGISVLKNLLFLNLENNQFTSLPDEIGLLTDLKSLKIGNNRLKGALPETLGKLVNLNTLDLSQNELTSLPEGIGNMILMERLYLNDNKITELPEEIGNLTLLTEFTMDNNELTALPFELCNLNSLGIVSADHNQLTSVNLGLSMMKNLRRVKLSYNKLSANMPPLSHLEMDVFIDHNNLTFQNIAASGVPHYPANGEHYHYYGSQHSVELQKSIILFTGSDSVGVDIRDISPLSHPENSYRWYKNGVVVSDKATLGFANPSSSDEGFYYCQVVNTVYEGLTLTTDSLQFHKVSSLNEITDTILSNTITNHAFYNDTVTLLLPESVRGDITWQASLDSIHWVDLSSSGNDASISENIQHASEEKLVITPEKPALYRYKAEEGTCLPIYSDTAFISSYHTELLIDTLLNVSMSEALVTLSGIQITIPKNLAQEDFRLTVEKLNSAPNVPDTVSSGPVFDVKVSCGSDFDLPIRINLEVDHDSLLAENYNRFSGAYFDEQNNVWVPYKNSKISAQDSSLVFETYHLTKLSWWWDEECFLHGFTDLYELDKVKVFYKSEKHFTYFIDYQNREGTLSRHLSPGDLEYGTPIIIQDMAYYCNQVMTKFKSLGLETPESITIYADDIDDSGNVGIMGMLKGYINLNVVMDSREALMSTIAHEYMHYTQDYYISAHAGNTFWMEANGHPSDWMVWNSSEIPVSESEHYLLDSRSKVVSIFSSLSTSWDYWDTNILTHNALGNMDYCYLAGCFIHFMRSYTDGTKLKPEVLLKENTYTGSWKEYLNNYIVSHMNSTIGTQFEAYVKYIFEGSNSNFTVLNKEANAKGTPLKYLIQTGDNFSGKHLYRLPEDETEIPVIEDHFEKELPYLSARAEQFYNLSENRSLCVRYKRLHSDTTNIRVYLCQYEEGTEELIMKDISKVDSSFFFIEAATEDNMDAMSNQAHFLIINKSKDDEHTASYDLKILPVADFNSIYSLRFTIGNDFDPQIHSFSDGVIRKFYMGRQDNIVQESKKYTDSTFTVSCTANYYYGNWTQQIAYNFLNGNLKIRETSFTECFPVWDPDGCNKVGTTHIKFIELKDAFLEPLESQYVSQGAGIYWFNTLNTTETQSKVVSMSFEGTEVSSYDSGAEIIKTYNYTGTDWGFSPDIAFTVQFK